jgi:hypothetical protein
MKFIKLTFILLILFSNISFAEYIIVNAKHEEIQTAYWQQANSKSVVIWLPGGDGSFGFAVKNPPKPNWLFNHLSELENAPDIVFVDSSYGLGWKGGDLSPRRTARHIDNVAEIVKYYKEKTQKNVYLFGHSNGSVSVAEFLNASPTNQFLIAGAIFSASRNETEIDAHLNLPVLVMTHEKDPNSWTTPSSSLKLFEKIKNNDDANVEFAYVHGGYDEGNPATSGRHMYAGSLKEAADIVNKFVMATSKGN